MIYGYVRVSTMKQCTNVQRYEIQKWCKLRGLEVDSWIDEKISGTKSIKIRQIRIVLEEMKAGDTLICTEISRLGRSMQVVFEVMNRCLEKKVELVTLKEGYVLNDTPMSKFILSVYSYAAETERILISERTKEGLAAKKREGVILGRPKGSLSKQLKLDKYRDCVLEDVESGLPKVRIARKYGCNVSTLYDWLKKQGVWP